MTQKKEKEKWSDWIKKRYLAFIGTVGVIISFFKSVKDNLQNELNKFIVVPLIHLLVQNKEKYCEDVSTISSVYWKQNSEECDSIINFIFTGYIFSAFIFLIILLLNSSQIYILFVDLLQNNNQAKETRGRSEEAKLNTVITTKINKFQKEANEDLAKILQDLLHSLSNIKKLPTQIASIVSLYQSKVDKIIDHLAYEIKKLELKREASMEILHRKAIE